MAILDHVPRYCLRVGAIRAANFPDAIFDVDGTICFDGRVVGSEILEQIRLLRRSSRVVFASARPIRDLLPVLAEDLHDAPLIGGNGAFVREHHGLTVSTIDPRTRGMLDELIEQHNLSYLVDGDWDYSYNGTETHRIYRQLDAGRLARKIGRHEIAAYSKVVLFTDDPEIIAQVERLPLAVNVHPDESIVDLAPSGVTKLHALLRLGVEPGRFAAFGNDSNDVAMLREAGLSVCVGDHPELKFADLQITRAEVAATIASLIPAD